jgi:hypothetical protein
MSNTLSVRRVRVQTLHTDGTPDGDPTYGVMAADDYAQGYDDTFTSLNELNAAIEAAGSILDIVDDCGSLFAGIDREQIGADNFFGKVLT